MSSKNKNNNNTRTGSRIKSKTSKTVNYNDHEAQHHRHYCTNINKNNGLTIAAAMCKDWMLKPVKPGPPRTIGSSCSAPKPVSTAINPQSALGTKTVCRDILCVRKEEFAFDFLCRCGN